MAVKIIIEPLFEADFKESSYGFRPKRSAHQALDRIRKDTRRKGWWIVDTDIKGYFNNINHEKLMLMVKQRISDRRILKMIWKWLKAGVMENGILTGSELGSPQGGVILSGGKFWNGWYHSLLSSVTWMRRYIRYLLCLIQSQFTIKYLQLVT